MAAINVELEKTVSGDSQFMVSEYDLLASTNTFDIEALSKTLDYLATKNYWALYQNQKSRVQMDRYDIPISKFKLEYRTQYESINRMYSRRYIYYIKRPFIHYAQNKAYRYSELYQKEVNQETIGKHKDLFAWNFMLFVDGEFVTTCEVLPIESTTGVIIDLASKPGGVDQLAATKQGIKVIWALALPGKVAPYSAARCIKQTIYNEIKDKNSFFEV